MFADQLHTHGHVFGEATGQCECRDTGRVCRNHVNIGEVHFERIAGLLAEFEGSSRTGRGEEKVNGGKGSFKVATKKRAHLLSFEIVRIVISSRESVCAEHDPALDLIAESFATGLKVDVSHILRVL